MDIYTRVENLEKLVDSLVKQINNQKFYIDADIGGVRQNISEISPYTETKTAYINDTEIAFDNVPPGSIAISLSDPAISFSATKEDNNVTVTFEPLKEVTEVTLTIN